MGNVLKLVGGVPSSKLNWPEEEEEKSKSDVFHHQRDLLQNAINSSRLTTK